MPILRALEYLLMEAVSCGTLKKVVIRERSGGRLVRLDGSWNRQQEGKDGNEGSRNNRSNGNQVRGRAYSVNVNAMEAVKDPNVVTGTFSLNDHFVTVLFDSGADFSFISIEFAPLLNVKPSIMNPGYVIEVADGKKVEVDRVIRDCKLELGSSLFSINLIPLGHGSFDVIVGMDWLSQHKAVIVCHEKVVEIPVEDGRILRVHGERAVGITKALKSAKEDEPKLNDISVVREFEDVFPEDLSGLPPQRQVEFRIDLVPGATPIAKSPYRLAPSEMQELSGQLQELQDKGFIRPSHSPWGAPVLFVKKKDGSLHKAAQSEALKKENYTYGKAAWVRQQMENERTIQTLEDMLKACVIDFGGSWDVHLPLAEFSYNNSYHSSIRCAPFDRLVWKGSLNGSKRSSKSYADNRATIGFRSRRSVVVMLKSFTLERIGLVAYRLRLPEELSGVHDTFHVSNLKKCLADASLHVPLDDIKVDKTLRFVEEPVRDNGSSNVMSFEG
ncbi:putative reverse transcriptase domain-containing protein [Tanacetum coccineum]